MAGNVDTFEDEYARGLQIERQDAAIERMRTFMREQERPAAPAPAPEQQAEEQPQPRNRLESALFSINEALIDRSQAEVQLGQQAVGAVGEAAAGTAVVAKELPSRIAAGAVADATRETIQASEQLLKWVQSSGLGEAIQVEAEGPFDPEATARANERIFAGLNNLIPEFSDPSNTAGQLLRGFGTWMVPFMAALRPAKAVAGAAGVTGRFAQPAVGAGLAGIPADLLISAEANFSNMIQGTRLANPMSELLAIEEDDSDAVRRVKTAAEGMGLGFLAEGLVWGARTMRGMRVAHLQAKAAEAAEAGKDAPESVMDAIRKEVGEISNEDMARAFGVEDIDAPLIQERMAAAEARVPEGVDPAAARARRTPPLDPEEGVFINWNRIDSTDDANNLLRQVVNENEDALNQARRIGRSQQQVVAEANGAAPLTLREIFARNAGNPLSDVQSVQLRNVLQSATDRLLELEKRAINGGTAEQFAYRKMMVVHQGLLEQTLGARADASRSLSAWRISAKGDVERAMQVQTILDNWGGEELSRKLSRRMSAADTPKQRQEMLNRAWSGRTPSILREIGTLGLLWRPATHITNVASTTIAALTEPLERSLAARGRAVVGGLPGESAVIGEAREMYIGMYGSIGDSWRAAWERARTGESAFGAVSSAKIDNMRPAITAERFGMATGTGYGRAVDFVGKAHTLPGRMLGAEDEFFKMIGYRRELHALAFREAQNQAVAEGLTSTQMKKRYAEILNSPPESIRVGAIDASAYSTFTKVSNGNIAKALRLTNQLPAGYLVVPFVNTPVNIAAYGLERAGPLALLNRGVRSDIAAGGARRDVALARMAGGAGALMLLLDLAEQGHITGKGPPRGSAEREALQRVGWMDDSFYLEGSKQWVSWRRLDQYAPILSMAAEFADLHQRYELNEDDLDDMNEILAASASAIAHSMTNRTWTTGMSDFFQMLSTQRSAEWYFQRRLQQQVPISSALRMVVGTGDPTIPDVNGLLTEPIQALIPDLASRLPRKRDLWGFVREPDPSLAPWFTATTPVQVSRRRGEDVDEELVRMEAGLGKIKKKGRFMPPVGGAVEVNFRDFPRAYERYVELAGHAAKDRRGNGALEMANETVNGQGLLGRPYTSPRASDDDKLNILRSITSDFRVRGRNELWNDPAHADFREYVEDLQAREGVQSILSR